MPSPESGRQNQGSHVSSGAGALGHPSKYNGNAYVDRVGAILRQGPGVKPRQPGIGGKANCNPPCVKTEWQKMERNHTREGIRPIMESRMAAYNTVRSLSRGKTGQYKASVHASGARFERGDDRKAKALKRVEQHMMLAMRKSAGGGGSSLARSQVREGPYVSDGMIKTNAGGTKKMISLDVGVAVESVLALNIPLKARESRFLLEACAVAGDSLKAYQVFQRMSEDDVKHDLTAFNLVLLAAERHGNWQRASIVLGQMRATTPPVLPDFESYRAVVSTACHVKKFDQADSLFAEGVVTGAVDHWHPVIGAPVLDLRGGFSFHMAQTSLRHCMEEYISGCFEGADLVILTTRASVHPGEKSTYLAARELLARCKPALPVINLPGWQGSDDDFIDNLANPGKHFSNKTHAERFDLDGDGVIDALMTGGGNTQGHGIFTGGLRDDPFSKKAIAKRKEDERRRSKSKTHKKALKSLKSNDVRPVDYARSAKLSAAAEKEIKEAEEIIFVHKPGSTMGPSKKSLAQSPSAHAKIDMETSLVPDEPEAGDGDESVGGLSLGSHTSVVPTTTTDPAAALPKLNTVASQPDLVGSDTGTFSMGGEMGSFAFSPREGRVARVLDNLYHGRCPDPPLVGGGAGTLGRAASAATLNYTASGASSTYGRGFVPTPRSPTRNPTMSHFGSNLLTKEMEANATEKNAKKKFGMQGHTFPTSACKLNWKTIEKWIKVTKAKRIGRAKAEVVKSGKVTGSYNTDGTYRHLEGAISPRNRSFASFSPRSPSASMADLTLGGALGGSEGPFLDATQTLTKSTSEAKLASDVANNVHPTAEPRGDVPELAAGVDPPVYAKHRNMPDTSIRSHAADPRGLAASRSKERLTRSINVEAAGADNNGPIRDNPDGIIMVHRLAASASKEALDAKAALAAEMTDAKAEMMSEAKAERTDAAVGKALDGAAAKSDAAAAKVDEDKARNGQ